MSAAVAVLLAACSGGGDTPAGDGTPPGGTLPDLELVSLDGGEPLRLAELGDGPVVVNLWATWCTPCREEMPAIDAVAGAVGDDVRFVGVNIGDGTDAAQGFVEDVAVGFPQYLDEEAVLHAEVGATGMPTTVFVDDGAVVDLHPGALTEDELAAELEQRFGVTAPAEAGEDGEDGARVPPSRGPHPVITVRRAR